MNLLMLSGDTQAAQGIEGAFSHLLRRFARHWSRIDILCPPVTQPIARLGENVYFHPNPGGKWRQPLFIAQQGAALHHQHQYSLMVSHDYGIFLNGWGALRLHQQFPALPWVSELHHIEGYPRAASSRERFYRWWAGRYIRFVKAKVTAFRVVNQGEMLPLLRSMGVASAKILIIPSLYLDFETFRPLPDEPKRYDLLCVGRLAPNKGLPLLLDALAQLRSSHPDVQLAILGQGVIRSAIEAQVERLQLAGNVIFLPRAEDAAALARLYNQSRLLICTSTSEGGPRVTVEAMACGIPVLSTPVGVMPELLTGELAPLRLEWDAAAIAAKISWLLDDAALREKLGKSGQQAVQRFDAATMIDQYASAYQQLVGEG